MVSTKTLNDMGISLMDKNSMIYILCLKMTYWYTILTLNYGGMIREFWEQLDTPLHGLTHFLECRKCVLEIVKIFKAFQILKEINDNDDELLVSDFGLNYKKWGSNGGMPKFMNKVVVPLILLSLTVMRADPTLQNNKIKTMTSINSHHYTTTNKLYPTSESETSDTECNSSPEETKSTTNILNLFQKIIKNDLFLKKVSDDEFDLLIPKIENLLNDLVIGKLKNIARLFRNNEMNDGGGGGGGGSGGKEGGGNVFLIQKIWDYRHEFDLIFGISLGPWII